MAPGETKVNHAGVKSSIHSSHGGASTEDVLRTLCWAPIAPAMLSCGCGSKLNHQRTAGLSPCFHLPGQAIWGLPHVSPTRPCPYQRSIWGIPHFSPTRPCPYFPAFHLGVTPVFTHQAMPFGCMAFLCPSAARPPASRFSLRASPAEFLFAMAEPFTETICDEARELSGHRQVVQFFDPFLFWLGRLSPAKMDETEKRCSLILTSQIWRT